MTTRTSSTTAVAWLLGLAMAAAACDIRVNENGVSLDISEGKATDEWTRTYTVARGGRVEIVNVNGRIEAFPASGPEVEVHVTREVKGQSDDTARAMLDKLEMSEDVGADHVKVEARLDREQTSGGLGRRMQVTLNYRVLVPPGVNVSLKTENGGVSVERLQGDVVAVSTNGGVTGRGLTGPLQATTVNGGIQLDLATVTGEVRILTVNGGIRLDLPADVNANLEAGAVNGGVNLDESFGLAVADGDRRRVSGKLNAGGPPISAQTTNGGVRIRARSVTSP